MSENPQNHAPMFSRHVRWLLAIAAINVAVALVLIPIDAELAGATAMLAVIWIYYAGLSLDRELPYRSWAKYVRMLVIGSLIVAGASAIALRDVLSTVSAFAGLIAVAASFWLIKGGWIGRKNVGPYTAIEQAAVKVAEIDSARSRKT